VNQKYDNIILSGSISIDRIMNFSGKYRELIQADKLHVLSLSILIDKLTNSRGGTATNIAYNLSLLGDKPIVLGSIGQDAKDYLTDLTSYGIDTKYIHISKLPTATFTVLTDLEDNQVGGFYPGAMSDITNFNLKPWYGQNPLLVISAGDPRGMDNLVKESIKNHIDYVYDPGQQVTNISPTHIKLGLSHATILMVNDYELGVLIAKSGLSEAQLNQTIPLIVTTLGSAGTRLSGSSLKKILTVKAVPNVKIVDPTGAGDSYRAGFLYGYLRQWDLTSCASLGSTVASYAISQHGTQNHHFSLAELGQKHYSAYGTKLNIN